VTDTSPQGLSPTHPPSKVYQNRRLSRPLNGVPKPAGGT
jgi:hypothetical protein